MSRGTQELRKALAIAEGYEQRLRAKGLTEEADELRVELNQFRAGIERQEALSCSDDEAAS